MRARLRFILAGLATVLTPLLIFIAWPLPSGLTDYRPIASVRILDREGGLLRELRSSRDGRSTPVLLGDLPTHVPQAFLSAEDHGFRAHLGVSPTAIARAAKQNFEAGRTVAGGSTITMQLARTLVPRERTVLGKLQEVLWALRLEAHLSKDEILEQYLNRISFGNNTYGLEAAAQLYFGRSAKHLSIGQAAALAAIPKGPSAYNPYQHPERLAARQRWVLFRMNASDDGPLDLVPLESSFRAPHFVEYVADHLGQWGLSDATEITTTLDPKLQQLVEEQIREEVGRLSERRVSSAAAVVIDNTTSEVLAYQGSADFFDATILGQNDGIQMHRQPGSALKPFVYAEAFTRGFTPATVIPDLETHFGSRKGTYAPKNYDRKTHGPVRVREALANSYNVPAVRVADELGTAVTLAALQRAGFTSLDKGAEYYGLGVALGNGEVTLWEAARAYSGLSRGGVLEPLKAVLLARRADGTKVSPRPELDRPRRFADARAAALVTHILSDNAARARAFGLDNALRFPFPVAAKTGTSKGYSDNWTLGFTHERTVAVWAGNFDGTPMIQVSGITGAGPIFKRVMSRAMLQQPVAPLLSEEGLQHAKICPLSGQRAGPQCPSQMDEVFIVGTEPKQPCAMHRAVPAELEARCGSQVTDLGTDYYDWAHHTGLQEEPWLAASCHPDDGTAGTATKILSPSSGDEYLLLDDLPLGDQAIPLRIRASPKLGPLEVRVDGAVVVTLFAPFTGRVPARKGSHLLTVHAHGEALASVRYVVRSDGP
jgi:penicillin-binding protein 1C